MAKSDRDSCTYGWILSVECVAVNWVVVGGLMEVPLPVFSYFHP